MNPSSFASPPAKSGNLQRGEAFALLTLLLIGFGARVWLSQHQRIGPDEGAHLMDARLALDGLVPGIDFGSRQPLYVYVTALFSKVAGASLFQVRLLPVMLSTATGYVVFLIGRILLGARAAMIAAALCLFLPFAIDLSAKVQTEPLTILLSSLAVLWFARGLASGRLFLLGCAGAATAFAFYVRQSALSVLAALAMTLVIREWRSPGTLVRRGAAFGVGFVSVCLATLALYLTVAPASQVWESRVDPISFLVHQVMGRQPEPPQPGATALRQDRSAPASSSERSDQTWGETVTFLRLSVGANLVLLVSGLLAGLLWLTLPGRGARSPPIVLLGWTLWLGVAYAYYTVQRGFFPGYMTELIPPLSLLTGFAVTWSLDQLRSGSRRWGDILVIGCLAVAFFLAAKVGNLPTLRQPVYFVVPAIAFGIGYLFVPEHRWRDAAVAGALAAGIAGFLIFWGAGLGQARKVLLYAGVIPLVLAVMLLFCFRTRVLEEWRRSAAFVALSLMVGSLAVSLDRQAKEVAQIRGGIWAPQSLRTATEYLRAHAGKNQTVLSGAVIWEYEAGLRPFRNQSHPLAYLGGIPPRIRDSIEAELRTAPPEFVVLDGYTERTYLNHLPVLDSLLSARYFREVLIRDAPFGVKIFRLRDSTTSGQALGSGCCANATVVGVRP